VPSEIPKHRLRAVDGYRGLLALAVPTFHVYYRVDPRLGQGSATHGSCGFCPRVENSVTARRAKLPPRRAAERPHGYDRAS
jgi:peptidoglycan/LPS O-acetylase OafA/YrhL